LHGWKFLAVHLKRLEEILRASESLITNGNDFAIGHLVVLLELRAVDGLLKGIFVVKSNEAELLLDVSDDFKLSRGLELVRSLKKELG
jgi:hypothetical protein